MPWKHKQKIVDAAVVGACRHNSDVRELLAAPPETCFPLCASHAVSSRLLFKLCNISPKLQERLQEKTAAYTPMHQY